MQLFGQDADLNQQAQMEKRASNFHKAIYIYKTPIKI